MTRQELLQGAAEAVYKRISVALVPNLDDVRMLVALANRLESPGLEERVVALENKINLVYQVATVRSEGRQKGI